MGESTTIILYTRPILSPTHLVTDMKLTLSLVFLCLFVAPAEAQDIAIRAGHLVDVESSTIHDNQIILISDGLISSIGEDVDIPDGARVIDLSDSYVLPGLIESHTHMALTRQARRDFGAYYFTTLLEPTPYRAIQGVTNSRSMLETGFTTIRDVGNAGNYADTDLRRAIEEGWIPGPKIINSGRLIAPFGGQFHLQPEKPELAEPEYFFADTQEELRKAVRQNVHFGAKVIKLIVDNQPYVYTEEDIRAAVDEASRMNIKVAAHAYWDDTARSAIMGGVASIEHGTYLSDEILQLMKDRHVYLVGTDFPRERSPRAYDDRIDRIRRAYRIGTPMAFGTDETWYRDGETRGSLTLEFLASYVEADIPAPYILKMMTVNGADLLGISDERGVLQEGLAADIVAVSENPLDDIMAIHGVHFVMRDGLVYKENNHFHWDIPLEIGR